MGPALLVTLGLLFLLANMSNYPIQRTWPILLIVMGAIKLARCVVPESEHVNPGQSQPYSPFTPPPAPMAGTPGDGNGQNDEVHHG
jgi:hypothetical protein